MGDVWKVPERSLMVMLLEQMNDEQMNDFTFAELELL
jgi:hypothetical protein